VSTHYGPLTMQPVIDRLVTALSGVNVRKAADLAAIADAPLPDRIVIVLPAREVPSNRQSSGSAYRQQVRVDVSVLIGARGYGDPLDFASGSDLQTLVASARARLLNWRHPDAGTVFGLNGGQLQQVDPDGTAWWLETYSCDYWLEINP
jgi:hypothetical protein